MTETIDTPTVRDNWQAKQAAYDRLYAEVQPEASCRAGEADI